MPAKGSYSPVIPTTEMVQDAPLLTSHCELKFAPRGASGGATPTMRVMAAERPPYASVLTWIVDRVPGWASARVSIDTVVPDWLTMNADPPPEVVYVSDLVSPTRPPSHVVMFA